MSIRERLKRGFLFCSFVFNLGDDERRSSPPPLVPPDDLENRAPISSIDALPPRQSTPLSVVCARNALQLRWLIVEWRVDNCARGQLPRNFFLCSPFLDRALSFHLSLRFPSFFFADDTPPLLPSPPLSPFPPVSPPLPP